MSTLCDNFWTLSASCPERTGDYATIIRGSDVSVSMWLTAVHHQRTEGAHSLVVPLSPRGSASHRIALWRETGRDFSDREILLLKLIRPHLAEMRDVGFRRRGRDCDLTARQRELLRMVAGGQTNRQIARRLHIAEGTVRKHLENINARLGASNRASAVTRAFVALD
jgi:DNA-binding CsgD family transcriptional regulator